MPLLKRHSTLLLGIWKVEESVEELLSMLDKQEQYLPFLEKTKAESRKKEWLATRVLLKELLGEESPIAYNPDESPYLPERPGCFISISHTKGYVAVYCGQEKGVGVDIEHTAERILKIKHKFMSPEELAWIEPEHQVEHLLICWCAKETLFKLIRQTEVDFREHLHIEPFRCGEMGEVNVRETKTPASESFKLEYIVTPEFVLTFSR